MPNMPGKHSTTPSELTLQSRFAKETTDSEGNVFLNERFY